MRDERLGEEICAWIRLEKGHEATTSEDIIRLCQHEVGAGSLCTSLQLALFKVPRYIILRTEFDFPQLDDGRPDWHRTRELSEQVLGIPPEQ